MSLMGVGCWGGAWCKRAERRKLNDDSGVSLSEEVKSQLRCGLVLQILRRRGVDDRGRVE